MPFSFALCSEVFSTPIDETIREVARLGFDGIEIAPFNVAPSVTDVPAERRAEIRRLAEDEGLRIVGLHWLLLSPDGLHLTTPDAAVRRRTIDYMIELARFCSDLGGAVMVLGSPRQRDIAEGDDPIAATERAADGLREVAAECAERGVELLLEPLHPQETNFLQTVEEAKRLAERIDSPSVGYILDCKAMSGMPRGIVGTIEEHGAGAGHFHANEPGGLGPGMGTLDFVPILRALRQSGYSGWVSTEPFHYEPDPVTVGRAALDALRRAADAV